MAKKQNLDERVTALENWRSETTELGELRKRVADQANTIVSLQQQLIHEQQRRIQAELR